MHTCQKQLEPFIDSSDEEAVAAANKKIYEEQQRKKQEKMKLLELMQKPQFYQEGDVEIGTEEIKNLILLPLE